jgi:hypothetical protein
MLPPGVIADAAAPVNGIIHGKPRGASPAADEPAAGSDGGTSISLTAG